MTPDEMARRLMQKAEEIRAAVEEGLDDAGERMLAEARANVPVQTGELRDSGRVVKSGLSVKVEFEADYAATIHEDPRSSGYKFLEGSSSNVDVKAIVAQRVKEQM